MAGLYVASNVTALGAQHVLTNNMNALTNSLTRLSTGLRINSGKDDPAGLIASEMLKSDMVATSKAITNTQRANSVMSIAESALGQVNSLLNDIRGLVNESANTGAMSAEQIAANQLQIDASLDSIDRIARNTNFQGMKLLDGSLDFSTRNVDKNAISNLQINSANFGTADSLDISVKLEDYARKGTLIYYGTGAGEDTVVRIGGSSGSELFKFAAGTTTLDMTQQINALTDSTGVAAFVEGLAARGSLTLSSTGADNDIVITANELGFDAGNYTFRVTKGTTNDVRLVSEPALGVPGVVEISLEASYEQNFENFAGLFNIVTDVTNRVVDSNGNVDLTLGAASVNMTRGNSNIVQYLTANTNATGTGRGGATISANVVGSGTNGQHTSELNGWTIVIGGEGGTANGTIDTDAKTITFSDATNATAGKIATALEVAIGDTSLATNPDVSAGTAIHNVSISGTLKMGDRITLSGGGDAGELLIQYKAGATVGTIQDLLNRAPNIQASLVNGVSRDAVISNLPNGKTYMRRDGVTNSSQAILNQYASRATSQTVIDLINSKLGDKFSATALKGDTTGGRVTFQDASEVYGDFNLDNALRFSGMDSGPVIRLMTQDTNGIGIPYQELSVSILLPSEKDVANGIHTPVLQINLATDGAGNSITTAKQIANLFDRLTPAETLGVSAELLLPPGTDPNGRIWSTDYCGNTIELDTCDVNFGNGIVQPTGTPGCEPQMNDIFLFGDNQLGVADKPFVGFASSTAITPVAAIAFWQDETGNNATTISLGNTTSALNGTSFAFTRDERAEGFDDETGVLTVYIPPNFADNDAPNNVAATAFNILVNGAIDANWEAIRAFTQYGGEKPSLGTITTTATAFNDISNAVLHLLGHTFKIPASDAITQDGNNAAGTRGYGANDAVMTITANYAGIEMAGVKIYFEQDDTKEQWVAHPNAASGEVNPVDLSVDYVVLNDGSKSLIIKANQGLGVGINTKDLVAALNGDTKFSELFHATGLLSGGADAVSVGTIDFNRNVTQHAGITQGGYRINSPGGTGTSSGIWMTGQSDSNERLILEATEYGSDHFVNVSVVEGSFDTYCPLGNRLDKLAGKDAVATINGQRTAAQGNVISTSQFAFDGSMDISGMQVGTYSTFTITGGGAVFQLGPDVVSVQQIHVGLPNVSTGSLGGSSGRLYQLKSGGTADMKTNTKLADKIVQEAISSVSITRGRIGAIQRSTLDPNIQALQDNLEALTAAEADISNADFAEESSNMARYQILVQSAATVLAQANQLPQYAATLVG